MSDRTLKDDLSRLAETRVFFGHQSVGNNILNGLKELAQDDPSIPLHIVRLDDTARLPENFFAEKAIGENTEPALKCEDFKRTVEERLNGDVDIAMMKFCYVDIGANTNVDEVFQTYCTTMDSLKRRFPAITFVHITVPLTFAPAWWKQLAGKILGRKPSSEIENVNRNRFNTLLRERFRGEPIFDLDSVESTYPDGHRLTFESAGKDYFALIPEYSGDGAHLNREGSRRAAATMVKTLAEAMRQKGLVR